jgi:hypothetical protein
VDAVNAGGLTVIREEFGTSDYKFLTQGLLIAGHGCPQPPPWLFDGRRQQVCIQDQTRPGGKAAGRKVFSDNGTSGLREPLSSYKADFMPENDRLRAKKMHYWKGLDGVGPRQQTDIMYIDTIFVGCFDLKLTLLMSKRVV